MELDYNCRVSSNRISNNGVYRRREQKEQMREGGEGRNGNGIVMREKCVYKGGNNHGKNMVENVVKMFDRFEENVRIDYVAVRGGQWKHYRRCLETEFVKLFQNNNKGKYDDDEKKQFGTAPKTTKYLFNTSTNNLFKISNTNLFTKSSINLLNQSTTSKLSNSEQTLVNLIDALRTQNTILQNKYYASTKISNNRPQKNRNLHLAPRQQLQRQYHIPGFINRNNISCRPSAVNLNRYKQYWIRVNQPPKECQDYHQKNPVKQCNGLSQKEANITQQGTLTTKNIILRNKCSYKIICPNPQSSIRINCKPRLQKLDNNIMKIYL